MDMLHAMSINHEVSQAHGKGNHASVVCHLNAASSPVRQISGFAYCSFLSIILVWAESSSRQAYKKVYRIPSNIFAALLSQPRRWSIYEKRANTNCCATERHLQRISCTATEFRCDGGNFAAAVKVDQGHQSETERLMPRRFY